MAVSQTSNTVANPYSSLLGTQSTSNAASDTTTATGQQDRFLKLLVAQLKNQDPSSPADSSQMTSQMAQISTVDGISKLNDTVKALAASYSATQTLQSAMLVGKGALLAGNNLQLSSGQGLAGYELTQPVDNLTLTIKDAAGAVVYKKDMGAQEPGIGDYIWDGSMLTGQTAKDGNYTMSWTATQGSSPISVNSLSYGRILGVNQTANGMTLSISGQNSDVVLSQIKQIL